MLLLAAAFLPSACASVPGGDGRLAFLDVSGASGCTVRAQNRPFRLPEQADALSAELTRLAARHGGALVAAADPAPDFRCRTGFMLSLRTAGFRRLGFLDDFDGAAPE